MYVQRPSTLYIICPSTLGCTSTYVHVFLYVADCTSENFVSSCPYVKDKDRLDQYPGGPVARRNAVSGYIHVKLNVQNMKNYNTHVEQ